MKKLIVLCVAIVAVASLAWGQETSSTKVGFDIGIEPLRLVTVGSSAFSLAMTPATFGIPIEFAAGRFEPEVGIFRYSSESGGTTRTGNFYRFGAGFFFPIKKGEHSTVYFGPKVGLFLTGYSTESTGSTSETTETDFFVSANIGGEHIFSDGFRFYGEAQFYYLSFGNPEYTPAPPTTTERSQSILFTNLVVGVRFYF